MLNIKGILYPEEVLNKSKDLLAIYYATKGTYKKELDYRTVKKIKEKIENAVFIFDSNPVEAFLFFVKHHEHINDNYIVRRTVDEYNDYVSLRFKAKEKLEKLQKKELAKLLQLPASKIDSKILKMDFNSYSYDSIAKLTKTNEKEKEEIQKRQKKYIMDYKRLLNSDDVLTDPNLIEIYNNAMKKINDDIEYELIKKSLYGKRILKSMKKQDPFWDLDKFLQTKRLIRQHEQESNKTNVAFVGIKGKKKIVFLPLMKIANKNISVDRAFFHELLHVLEDKEGLAKYKYLNEIKTDQYAIEDSLNIDLFETDKSNIISDGYQPIFEITKDLFTAHRSLFQFGNNEIIKTIEDDLFELEKLAKNKFENDVFIEGEHTKILEKINKNQVA